MLSSPLYVTHNKICSTHTHIRNGRKDAWRNSTHFLFLKTIDQGKIYGDGVLYILHFSLPEINLHTHTQPYTHSKVERRANVVTLYKHLARCLLLDSA